MNNKTKETYQDYKRSEIFAKIIIDILILLLVIFVSLIILYLIANRKMPLPSFLATLIKDMPTRNIYLATGIGSIVIVAWNIYTKGTLKFLNDAILTLGIVIAALKIFSIHDEPSFPFVKDIVNNENLIGFISFLFIMCGIAKIFICLIDFFSSRVSFYKEKLESENKEEK